MIREFKLEQGEIEYVQRVTYLKEGYKILLSDIMSRHKYSNGEVIEFDKSAYDELVNAYHSVNMEFNLLMNELHSKYDSEGSKNSAGETLSVNFNTGVLTVTTKN